MAEKLTFDHCYRRYTTNRRIDTSPFAGMRMILVFCAVLILTILLFGLFLRDREQRYPSEHRSSSYSSCRDLSIALREVCWDVLTPNSLAFLTANAPAKVVTSFGQQQQRLARYSLRIASDTLVQSLADGSYGQSSFARGFVGVRRSEARGLFLLVVCTAGRLGLGALRSVNWGVPRSLQAWISAKVLMSLGTLLAESTSVAERRLQAEVIERSEARCEVLASDRPSTEASLGGQIHEALVRALPNDMSRMIYIATMRDNNSGHYYYPELTRKFSADIVDRAMLACHGQLFERVVQLSLEDLTESLDVYMASTHVLKERVIQSWNKLRAYRATIPINSDPISAEVFFMKVEVAVAILEARLPADSYSAE